MPMFGICDVTCALTLIAEWSQQVDSDCFASEPVLFELALQDSNTCLLLLSHQILKSNGSETCFLFEFEVTFSKTVIVILFVG